MSPPAASSHAAVNATGALYVNTLQAGAEFPNEAHNGQGWTSVSIAPALNNYCSLTYQQVRKRRRRRREGGEEEKALESGVWFVCLIVFSLFAVVRRAGRMRGGVPGNVVLLAGILGSAGKQQLVQGALHSLVVKARAIKKEIEKGK